MNRGAAEKEGGVRAKQKKRKKKLIKHGVSKSK
jgi:hypothetical protein